MAGPKRSRSRSVYQAANFLPIWTSASTDINTAIFISTMHRLGIISMSDYLRRWAILNILCALIGAAIGLTYGGFLGLVAGALLGIATPAAVIWLAVTVVHAAAYLAIFCSVWVAFFYVIRWLFSSAL